MVEGSLGFAVVLSESSNRSSPPCRQNANKTFRSNCVGVDPVPMMRHSKFGQHGVLTDWSLSLHKSTNASRIPIPEPRILFRPVHSYAKVVAWDRRKCRSMNHAQKTCTQTLGFVEYSFRSVQFHPYSARTRRLGLVIWDRRSWGAMNHASRDRLSKQAAG